MSEELKNILAQLEQMNSKMEQVGSKMEQMDSKIQQMDSRMEQMDSRMQKMDSRMDRIESRMDHMDSKVGQIAEKTDSIQLRLENEVIRDIKIIAEGHIDLSRKLDEALKGKEERELILIRLNHLEYEVGEIKKISTKPHRISSES